MTGKVCRKARGVRCWGHLPGPSDSGGASQGGASPAPRDGFEWALRQACLSSYARGGPRRPRHLAASVETRAHPCAVGPGGRPAPAAPAVPSLQLGLSGEAVRRYADEWTVAIRDVTPLAHEIQALVTSGNLDSAARLLPQERPCPVGD
ncbi:DUF4291 family protein [Streptomyces sp. NPDC001275]